MSKIVTIIGGGFAGVECAWSLANQEISVHLYEMRPQNMTPAHKTEYLAELVCSNSFKSKNPDSPAGLLKEEMNSCGSIVIPTAFEHSVPGGSALAVDRNLFSASITEKISKHPRIHIIRKEFTPDLIQKTLENGPIVIAGGPLLSSSMSEWLRSVTKQEELYFYDAVSPVVDATSINRDIVFAQSRYDKGEGDDYLNCPFNLEEYEAFIDALLDAEKVTLRDFEDPKYFESCMPIDVIASRGRNSLAFGNFKPVGLTDPRTGKRPYAVLQLRTENREKSLYSLVACQNRLKWGDQKKVLQMIPGLEQAEFVRYGVVHRNTYVNAPQVLSNILELKDYPNIFIGGQLTGVEGYLESAATGVLLGYFIGSKLKNKEIFSLPRDTALGSLCSHLQDDTPKDFAPMNINWGLLPSSDYSGKRKSKEDIRNHKIQNAHIAFKDWFSKIN